jgi:hypothetical protein
MTGWVPPSRKAFLKFSKELLQSDAKGDYEAGSDLELFKHQRIAAQFLQHGSPFRGLLLYHGLGSGKSCSSIIAAGALMSHMKVAVFLPASLHTNFVDEVGKCGNQLFRKGQTWAYVDAASPDFAPSCQALGLDPASMKRRRGGVWVVDAKKGQHFDTLDPSQQESVARQIEAMIHAKYEFHHTNGGFTEAKLDAMLAEKPHPFANKLIIIDEAHDMVSRAVGSGVTGKKLYQLLVTAPGAKVLALSGTPLINYPDELAYLVGLLKGYSTVFSATYDEGASADSVVDVLRVLPEVDLVDIDNRHRHVRYTRLPRGFRWRDASREEIVAHADSDVDDKELQARILKALSGARASPSAVSLVSPLPLDRETFMNMFIDEQRGKLLHQETLASRLIGCISHHNSYSADLYPTLLPTTMVKVVMSSHQWLQYEDVRMKERQMEDRSARMRNIQGGQSMFQETSSSTYRAFSRAVCNFAFPKFLVRPWPSSVRDMLESGSDDTLDGNADDAAPVDDPGEFKIGGAVNSAKDAYTVAITRVLSKLQKMSDAALVGEGLRECSPKFSAFLERLKVSPGPALVYSQFRHVEGIGVLSLVLDANGYAELKLEKDKDGQWTVRIAPGQLEKPKYASFGPDRERNRILLAVFNSDFDRVPPRVREALGLDRQKDNLHGQVMKLLQITQSGAQGISLQNVRQVHILEPFWNQIRIDQVIGRAVRAHSHKRLPPEERQVEVFMYICQLSKDQKSSSATIRIKDNGLTSDQYVRSIAERKSNIIGQMLEVMKATSIDCSKDCWTPDARLVLEEGNVLSMDIQANAAREDRVLAPQRKNAAMKVIEYKGTRYIMNQDTGDMFDYVSFQDGRQVKVGKVVSGKVLVA